jgi:hypothetical protein
VGLSGLWRLKQLLDVANRVVLFDICANGVPGRIRRTNRIILRIGDDKGRLMLRSSQWAPPPEISVLGQAHHHVMTPTVQPYR